MEEDEGFKEEDEREKRMHPWRKRCVPAAQLRAELCDSSDADADALAFAAMRCAPEDFAFAKDLCERALRLCADSVPALLTLHMLYNFSPAVFFPPQQPPSQAPAARVFAHSAWARRVRGLPADAQARAEAFFASAAARVAPAQVPAALLNLHGFWLDIVRADMSGAARLWTQAAALGFPSSINSLAVCTANGEGLAKDAERALQLFVAGARQGHANTQRNLGWTYNEAGDAARALQLFRLAAAKGHASALVDLATYWRDGLGGLERDSGEYLRVLRLAVHQGEPWAQCELGLAYEEGHALPRDCAAAAELYALAAAQDLSEGEIRLARLYSVGHGVPMDTERAVELLQSAVRHGSINAAFTLGLWFWSHRRHADARRCLAICTNNGDVSAHFQFLAEADIAGIAEVFQNLGDDEDAPPQQPHPGDDDDFVDEEEEP